MLNRLNTDGRYERYLPSLASSLMYYLHLKESDVFFYRVRVYARDVGLALQCCVN